MPEISVLMGTCNEKSSIQTARAIDSVLNQTFQDFEFIICDDGSDSQFFHWLKRYCRKDARIRLLRNQKNRGLAAVLNRCLAYAAGTYIARMDADDVSKAERFEKQVMFLRQNGSYALAGCNVQLMDEDDRVWGERRLEQMPLKQSFLSTSPFVHPAVMIRRSVLEELHGYCELPWALRVEDYELFMRLYARGYRGYNLQEVLFCYREGAQAYAKRRYRYRLNECRVRYQGFSELGILQGNLRYVLKPLAAGMMPHPAVRMLRAERYRVRE